MQRPMVETAHSPFFLFGNCLLREIEPCANGNMEHRVPQATRPGSETAHSYFNVALSFQFFILYLLLFVAINAEAPFFFFFFPHENLKSIHLNFKGQFCTLSINKKTASSSSQNNKFVKSTIPRHNKSTPSPFFIIIFIHLSFSFASPVILIFYSNFNTKGLKIPEIWPLL